MFIPELLTLFILAILIGYYYDYRRNRQIYKDKGQGILYVIIIAIIALILAFLILSRLL